MPNETMNDETQTAESQTAITEETLQQEQPTETGADSGVSETSPATENDSQTESQEETPEQTLGENADDQPVTPPTGQPAPASHDYAKENADLKAMIAQTMDVIKQRESLELQKSKPQAAPKGAWKETLAKAYKPEDASVLSAAMEAAINERFGDLDSVRQDVQFMKPHLERMGYENEMSRAGAALVAAGIPQSVVAKLRPDVDAAYKSGIVAPPEMVMWSAYAKLAAKDKTALATKTQAARTAAAKPKPPAPKNTTGPTQPKYVINKPVPGADPVEEMASFLKQFEKYK